MRAIHEHNFIRNSGSAFIGDLSLLNKDSYLCVVDGIKGLDMSVHIGSTLGDDLKGQLNENLIVRVELKASADIRVVELDAVMYVFGS